MKPYMMALEAFGMCSDSPYWNESAESKPRLRNSSPKLASRIRLAFEVATSKRSDRGRLHKKSPRKKDAVPPACPRLQRVALYGFAYVDSKLKV